MHTMAKFFFFVTHDINSGFTIGTCLGALREARQMIFVLPDLGGEGQCRDCNCRTHIAKNSQV
jgi:hypothetical protein